MPLSVPKILLGFLFVLIITNLAFVNVYIFNILPSEFKQIKLTQANSVSTDTNLLDVNQDNCSSLCQTSILSAVDTLEKKLSSLSAQKTLPPPTTQAGLKSSASASLPLENYVPLGTGSTTKNEWEDINGAESYINTASYPNIKTVYFEVSMRVPTKNGRVSARLYNVTDKHPVWFSEVSTEQDKSTFVGSAPITLDAGNKLYRVQMKTSLQYESILDFAKIKIITQ